MRHECAINTLLMRHYYVTSLLLLDYGNIN